MFYFQVAYTELICDYWKIKDSFGCNWTMTAEYQEKNLKVRKEDDHLGSIVFAIKSSVL